VWLQLEAAAPATLRRARRLLKRAGDAPRLLDADTEAALDGAAPVRRASGKSCSSPAWTSPLLHVFLMFQSRKRPWDPRMQCWSPAQHRLAPLTRVVSGAADLLQPASSSESEDEDAAEAPAAMGNGAYGDGRADTGR